MTDPILTTEEERDLARFVCRLSMTVAVDAYKASLPESVSDDIKEDMAMIALKPALKVLNKLGKHYVFSD